MERTFKSFTNNPLSELSELRLELVPKGDLLDINCQMRFARADVEFSSRSYRVGISQARLQLYLEGWETRIGHDVGDVIIPTVTRSSEFVQETALTGGVRVDLDTGGGAKGGVTGDAETSVRGINTKKLSTSSPPIKALPNNAWNVEAEDVDGSRGAPLDGTVMAGERLCAIQKKAGSNRSRIAAELQVRRSKICVEPTKGNILGKRFSLIRNKDAIVAKVLEKALSRESSIAGREASDSHVVASRVEFEES